MWVRRIYSIFRSQLEDIRWILDVGISQASKSKVKRPMATYEFQLKNQQTKVSSTELENEPSLHSGGWLCLGHGSFTNGIQQRRTLRLLREGMRWGNSILSHTLFYFQLESIQSQLDALMTWFFLSRFPSRFIYFWSNVMILSSMIVIVFSRSIWF